MTTISSHQATLSKHLRIWRSSLQQTMKAEIEERSGTFMDAIQNDWEQKGKNALALLTPF